MKLNYYAETDSLYIEFSDDLSVESVEISEGVVLDYDAKGKLVGIDIDNAGHKIELQDFFSQRAAPQYQDGSCLAAGGLNKPRQESFGAGSLTASQN
ncbi:MAG: DUF2283 domain-containing protein [Desulfovermiculus sp.]|nr:DUF2283 domain-containing protein [Desulfovermiculus sp.]